MQEKTEKPTRKKLLDARKRGEVSKSAHLTQALSLGVVLLMLAVTAPLAWRWCRSLFELIGVAAAEHDADARFWATVQWIVGGFLIASLVLLAVTAIGTAAAVALQVRGVFSLHPITPSFERLNPATNLKNIFSSKQIFELFKSSLELALLSWVFYLVVKAQLPAILSAQRTDMGTVTALAASVLGGIFFAAFVIGMLTSLVDYAHQKYQFLKKQRMSRQDLRYEHKDVEGDPLIRSHRKRFHRALLQAPLRQQVERATLVVTNPTHLAVGVRYVPGDTDVPMLVVKGADDLALEIRSIAASLKVPVVRAPPLARALYERNDEEEYISPEFFEAIAAILVAVQREADEV